jgi:hypothetical protein
MSLFKEEPKHHALVSGTALKCVVCGFDRFYSREAQLHSGVATFFQLEWLGDTAHCSVCAHCGYIHWFMPMK